MKARSKPCATSESSPRSAGSKAWASTPFFLSAARTIAPLLSDTGRSADLPPMRTATLPKSLMPAASEPSPHSTSRGVGSRRQSRPVASPLRVAPAPCSCRLTHDPDLGLKLDAEAVLHGAARMLDQRFDVRGTGASPRVDDEVGMLFRDACPSYRVALEPASLDQPRGVIAGRIAEHRPRVGQVKRLRFDASRQQRGNALAR